MTILADHEIKQRCTKPDAILFIGGEPVQALWGDDESLQRSKVWQEQFYAQCDPGQTVSVVRLENIKWGDTPAEKKYQEHLENFRPMIEPFVDHQVRSATAHGEIEKKIISYGLSSFGYDVRLSNRFKIFTNINSGIIDPMEMKDSHYVDHEGDFVIIPPNSYVLGHTVEKFNIPRDVMAICVGKSTYARAGAIINVTPIEPGFIGEVVIEISNSTPLPLKIHAGMGIAQFLFSEGTECDVSYGDRNGKYQNQTGITTARI